MLDHPRLAFITITSGFALIHLTAHAQGMQAQDADSTVALPSINVTAPLLERATGPVEGYRAERTATATRTDTALKDLPFNVNVVSRDSFDDRGAVELSEALDTVPGVRLASTSSGRAPAFLVRGFEDYSYVIDGFPLSATAGRADAFLDLANVERIEVLKGPASTLYGRGQPGGVINVVTRQPTRDFQFDGRLQTGSDAFHRGQATVSGPLDEAGSVTGRATLAAQTDQGFKEGPISDAERQAASAALRWEPDAVTRFDLSVDHTQQETPFDRGLPVTPETNTVTLPPERFLAEAWSTADADVTRTTLGAERDVTPWLTLRANARHDDARVEDTGIDFRGLESDGRTLARRYTDRREENDNLDIRLEALATFDTAGMAHEFLLGNEYVKSELDFTSSRSQIAPIDIVNPIHGAPRPAASFNSAFETTSETFSVYAQDSITLSPQWKLLAGVRHDSLSQRQNVEQSENPPKIDDTAWTGRLGVVYQPVEPLSLYASIAESFAPQLGTTRDNEALSPQTGDQVEVGAKWDVNDRLSLTASTFEITKQDVATPDPLDGDFSVLSGEQRSRGAELELVGEPVEGLQVAAGGAYIDARITQSNEGREDNRLNGVPYWSGSLWSTYTLQRGSLAGLELGAGAFYTGARAGDIDNSFDVDGYTRFDAMAAYPLNDQLRVSLNVHNVTNEAYVLAPVSQNENYPGEPLSVMASIDFTY